MLFPDGKRFAFSILDDTDDSTLQNVKEAYNKLREYGFRTTKTVWALDCPEGSRHFFAAETLQDQAYLDFVHDLIDDGFELAFHGATMESSRRERTIRALEFLKKEFGHYPKLFCNHGQNRENIYWGCKRFQIAPLRLLFRLAAREPPHYYAGESEESEYFWGDLCKQYIKYVRNFTFYRLNMLEVNPEMPYRLPSTKYVNYWFSSADAEDVHEFNRLLSYEALDKLDQDGGVCIISTHLGKGFVKDGKLNPDTENILKYLAKRPGWFVPVTTILDYLLRKRATGNELSCLRKLQLECRFVMGKIMAMRRIR
jgi:hypothetical protein